MSKTTRTLSGASQRKYFRAVLRAQEGVTPQVAELAAETFEREIAHIRVRLPIPERKPQPELPQQRTEQPTPVEQPAETVKERAAFDPFAFSVVVVVTKEGRDGLMRRLEEITDVRHLIALAQAQHISIPMGIDELATVREAIVQGALTRIANRRAAAS